MFSSSVERWRSLALSVFSQQLPIQGENVNTLLQKVGLNRDQFINLWLAIIQKESNGNPYALGDWYAGSPRKYPISSYEEALQFLPYAQSVGLGQLNWHAGTPQSLGYNGTKDGLLDPTINSYYSQRYFLYQLQRYRNIEQALSAYNAGSATSINIASYVQPILDLVMKNAGYSLIPFFLFIILWSLYARR